MMTERMALSLDVTMVVAKAVGLVDTKANWLGKRMVVERAERMVGCSAATMVL